MQSTLEHPGQGVVARNLTKSFDESNVIGPIDLELTPGTIVGLIGPSGCGKTTTVRLLAGLLSPSSGEARVFGTPSNELTSKQRANLGYLPQTPALFPELSLIENLSFHASMYGLPLRRRDRLEHLLREVELFDDRKKRVADSSGGMQRRLALAAALVHDPDVVFLDEPTAGIDPILRDKLWQRFHAGAAADKLIVVTTQYVGEAGHCDLVGLLSDGELLLLDTPDHLRHAAYDGEVVDVVTNRPLDEREVERLASEHVCSGVERLGPRGLRVTVETAAAAESELRGACQRIGVTVEQLDEHVVEYDEAFVRIVERHRTSSALASHGASSAVATSGGASDG